MARLRTWALLAILPLLGALGIASGTRLFWCVGDEVARTECCCPDDAPADPGQTALTSPCCCDITRALPASTPSEPAQKVAGLDRPLAQAFTLAAPATAPDAGPTLRQALDAFTTRPPPIPVLLRKQSFLI